MPVDSPEDLYGLPLEQFIEERTALARQLRASKQRDAAATVSKLKKPTVAAWAVNQLVRTQPKLIERLLKSGDDLAAVQAAGREGRDQLQQASRRQRATLDELDEKAAGLLAADGHPLTPAMRERVTETLRAAALDPDVREQLTSGCLTEELQSAGLFGLTATAPPKTGPPRKAAQSAANEAKKSKQREQDLREAKNAVDKATRDLERAERKRDEAQQALEDAQERLKRLSR